MFTKLGKILLIIFLVTYISPAEAQDDYTAEHVYTIPWGDTPNTLSDDFEMLMYDDVGRMIFPPSPWAISDSGTLVIAEDTSDGRWLATFDSNGILQARINCANLDLIPSIIAILETGEVAISGSTVSSQILILDSDLDIQHEIVISDITTLEEFVIFRITPTHSNSFWIAFAGREVLYGTTPKHFYKAEIFLDGTMSEPEITWDDIAKTGIPGIYIDPYGMPHTAIKDVHSYYYSFTNIDVPSGTTLFKYELNAQGTAFVEVYSHNLISDPGWEFFDLMDSGPRHFVTWDGDFYTIHATDDGMVLTKYTYHPPSPPNQDPICALDCPTLIMPEVLPIAVVFDASGSYDSDGDPITYHWDFNGDGIFDGIGDEYTGDPWNPTHEFNQYGIHEVSLKVMDNRDGECVETVVIEIVEG